jgi:hypothetical protein
MVFPSFKNRFFHKKAQKPGPDYNPAGGKKQGITKSPDPFQMLVEFPFF